MTQQLCAQAADSGAQTARDVDQLCATLFLNTGAPQTESNLRFVSDRLLHGDQPATSVLDLYLKVWRGERVPDDETDPLIAALRLSGVARIERGVLRVRNRIYARVFDAAWVTRHTEPAELRRQREAYRRGRNRVVAQAGMVIALLTLFAGLAIFSAVNARQKTQIALDAQKRADGFAREREAALQKMADALKIAQTERANAEREKTNAEREKTNALTQQHKAQLAAGKAKDEAKHAKKAEAAANKSAVAAHAAEGAAKISEQHARDAEKAALAAAAIADRARYIAGMNLIQREWEAGNIERVVELLEETAGFREPGSHEPPFEWSYWYRLCHAEQVLFKGHTARVVSVAFSPDGKRALTGSSDNTARLWDAATGHELMAFKGHTAPVFSVAFSPDGKRALTGSGDSTARLYFGDTTEMGPRAIADRATLLAHSRRATARAFPRTGRRAAQETHQ